MNLKIKSICFLFIFFIVNVVNAQIVAYDTNRIYTALEVGDYKNYCEYGDKSFFISDRARSGVNISERPTTSNSIVACMSAVNNNNQALYRYIKMELLPTATTCPSLNISESFPAGTPTAIFDFMKVLPQSFSHRYSANVYSPYLSLSPGLSKNNYCHYDYRTSYYGQGNIQDNVVYFTMDKDQLKNFVKGDKYISEYTTRYVNGAAWETVYLEEPTNTYYKLPKMEMVSEFTTDKYSITEDFNMNKGKYLSTTTREGVNKQELNNVLFFPGLLGSQLQSSYTNQIIWPSISKDIHSNLEVINAQSLYNGSLSYESSPAVYVYNDTKSNKDGGAMRNYFLKLNDNVKINTVDIYDSFLNELDKLKVNNEISDYSAIPYDFRLATDDVYCNSKISGIDKISFDSQASRAFNSWPWNCKNSYIYGELKRLMLTSKTGKATLIGHSYGGLVIKEILKELEDSKDPLLNKIDKVILIAVPQAGAPESVISLLHGKEIGHLGLPINSKTNRELADTFPSIYQLLPNDTLIKSLNKDSSTPLISFASRSNKAATNTPADYSKQINKYGNTIDNFMELSDYLLNKENSIRATTTNDLHRAASLYGNLLNHATTEKNKLDNYVPTSTIEIHQIAGWGIPTDIGYTYDYINMCIKYNNDGNVSNSTVSVKLNCTEIGSQSLLNVTLSKNGDDTVPVPSALWMDPSSHSNVHNWWVDLYRYNGQISRSTNFSKKHKDILAAKPALDKVLSLVRNQNNNIDFISDIPLVYKKDNYITYSAHSPVNMTVTDGNGNKSGYDSNTNTIVNNINDVYYEQIGDTKLIIAPADINHTINLTAYDDGVYTLNVNSYNGEGIPLASTTYYAIPTATNSLSYLKHDILATTTDSLILDYNHNGKADAILTTGGTYTASSTLPDTTPTSEYLYYLDKVQQVENPVMPIIKTRPTTTPPRLVIPKTPPRLSPVTPIIKLIKK